MSSEMFYPSGDDVDRMIELAIQCGIDNRGTSWPLELCHVRAKLRTLLARTEAGADGAVAQVLQVYKAEDEEEEAWFGHVEFTEPLKIGDLLYTHPHDASGDAEDRKALEYLMGQFDAEVHVCARCGHEDSTRDCDSAIYLRRHLGAMQQTNGGGE